VPEPDAVLLWLGEFVTTLVFIRRRKTLAFGRVSWAYTIAESVLRGVRR
jgi:hypothetical protein